MFGNGMIELAKMSVEGFLALGAPKLGEIMEKSLELYQQYDVATVVELKQLIPRGAGYDDYPVVRRYYNEHRNIFGELDEAFYAEEKSLDYVKYIRQNAECFGD